MARRSNRGMWEDVVRMLSALPWWASLALAPVAYLVIHLFATPPTLAAGASASAGAGGKLGAHAVRAMIAALASALQYVIPLACILASGVSAWRQRDRRRLAASVTHDPSANALNDIPWERFEHLVGEAFRRQGYEVRETGGASADGGVDLELRKGGELHLVQCKQRRAHKVGVEVVRQLFGVMTARSAAVGYVVTSGTFTAPAVEFAKQRNLRLIDGARLRRLLATVEEVPSPDSPPPVGAAEPMASTPACPRCSKSMFRRTATRGPSKGSEFWGCAAYPACKGTRPCEVA